MFKLLVIVPNSNNQWQLFFDQWEDGLAAQDNISGPVPVANVTEDSHGQRMVLGGAASTILIDLARSHEAEAMEALMRARTQAKIQTMAAADPTLRMIRPGAPGLIT